MAAAMIGARIAAMLQQGEHFVRAVCARLAWPEYLFLALTLFTVGMWIWVNGPLQGEIEQLRAERAQHQVPDRGAAADGLEARASDLPADFLSFLPPWAERDRHAYFSERGRSARQCGQSDHQRKYVIGSENLCPHAQKFTFSCG